MQVKDLFQRLSFGELSNLAIGKEGAGDISEGAKTRVVALINAALTGLYTRFPQKRGFLVLETVPGQQSYALKPENARSAGEAGFILDSAEQPFPDDIIKILDIVREDDPETEENEQLRFGINRRGASHSAQVTSHNTVRFDAIPMNRTRFAIEYQANHPKLEIPVDPEELIHIMPALEEALQVKVAAQIYSGMNGESHNGKAAELNSRYEQLCAIVEQEDMAQEGSSDETDRLRDKGFV